MNHEPGQRMERVLDLQGKRVTVIGLARSGAAACRLLVSRGARVTGSDHHPAEKIQTDLDDLRRRGVKVELGQHQIGSGPAACRLLGSRGARVTGSDHHPAEKIQTDLDDLRRRGVKVELGQHRPETFLQADLIVVSPGVDSDLPPLHKARSQGVRIWSEVELAFRAPEAPFIAVTGTNEI